MRIAFNFVLKILLVEKKSVKRLRRRNHSAHQRLDISYGKVKSKGEPAEKISGLNQS